VLRIDRLGGSAKRRSEEIGVLIVGENYEPKDRAPNDQRRNASGGISPIDWVISDIRCGSVVPNRLFLMHFAELRRAEPSARQRKISLSP